MSQTFGIYGGRYVPETLIPALDGLPNDIWVRGHNFVGSLDRVLLGPHVYVPGKDGYDPEGILGTFPAIAQGLIGLAVGEYVLRNREWKRLWIAGAAMLVVGIAWGFVFPVVKDIWSSTFVLVTSGIALVTLCILHVLFDAKPMTGDPGYDPEAMIPFGPKAIPENRWFESKGLVARLFIMVAGVVMNVVLAWAVFVVINVRYGEPVVPSRVIGGVHAAAEPGGRA